ncbi:MAG: hypothetical protein QXT37_07975 [Thermofilaceae archaeon]
MLRDRAAEKKPVATALCKALIGKRPNRETPTYYPLTPVSTRLRGEEYMMKKSVERPINSEKIAAPIPVQSVYRQLREASETITWSENAWKRMRRS